MSLCIGHKCIFQKIPCMDLPPLVLLVPSPPHPLEIFSELVYFPLKQTNNQNKEDKQNKQAKKTKKTTKSIKPYLKNLSTLTDYFISFDSNSDRAVS